jgi:hypothetical protein
MVRGEHANGVHFLHIGKTGGTSLKKLVKHNAITRTGDGRRLIMHMHSTTLPNVLGRSRRNQAAFFLRDPLARFVSGFNSRLREGAPIAHIPWKPDEKTAFEQFKSPNDLAEALSSTRPMIQDKAFSAMDAMIHTRMHFSHWLRSPEYLESRIDRIVFVGFQETYNEDVTRFFQVLGVPGDIQPEHFHEAPATSERTLSEVAQENLRRWYADDIVLYDWALAQRDRWAPAAAAAAAATAATSD